jgi:hypothetical protein
MEIPLKFEVVLQVEMDKHGALHLKKEQPSVIPAFSGYIANPSIRKLLSDVSRNGQ